MRKDTVFRKSLLRYKQTWVSAVSKTPKQGLFLHLKTTRYLASQLNQTQRKQRDFTANQRTGRMPMQVYSASYWIFNEYLSAGTYIAVTVIIQIDAHHPPPWSSSWHTKMGEIGDFCIKNTWIYNELSIYLQLYCFLMIYLRSDFKPIDIYQIYVLLTSNALLFEWLRY